MIFKHKNSGQTIIEAVIALSVILIILAAIAIVIINGLSNSRFVQNQNLANKYAQQGIEFVRNIQQNDINTFASYEGNVYCIDESTVPQQLATCAGDTVNVGNSHIRTISLASGISPCQATEKKITATVTWSSSKCPSSNRFCHRSELSSCLQFETSESSNP